MAFSVMRMLVPSGCIPMVLDETTYVIIPRRMVRLSSHAEVFFDAIR